MDTEMSNPASPINSAQSPLKKTQWLHSLLRNEVSNTPPPTTSPIPAHLVMAYSPTLYESHSTHANSLYNEMKHRPDIPPMVMETTTYFTPTTIPPISLTTDELFSHYKQPAAPLKGPMYVIIQGHSKVKTYGPKPANLTDKHVPKMVPVVSTKDPVVSHVVSEDEKGNSLEVMHLHKATQSPSTLPIKHSKTKSKNKNKPEKKPASTMDNLLSLLDTSFGGFFLNDSESPQANTGKAKAIQKDADGVNYNTTETTTEAFVTHLNVTVSVEKT